MLSTPSVSPAPPHHLLLFSRSAGHDLARVHLLRPPPCSPPAVLSLCSDFGRPSLLPIAVRISARRHCFAKSEVEDQLSGSGAVVDGDGDLGELEEEGNDGIPSGDSSGLTATSAASASSSSSDLLSLGIPEPVYEKIIVGAYELPREGKSEEGNDGIPSGDSSSLTAMSAASSFSSSDLLSLGIPEPVYEVVEVTSNGLVSTRKIHRKSLLKSSGLRPRDIRSVDPSLWLTNSMPSLLVRENAILLNLGSLRAIVMQETVLIFNYNRRGGKAFIDSLLPRLNPKNTQGGPCMPFVLEAVEAALVSRIQRLEQRMMDVEPRVQGLLEVLPNRLTANVLEQLRTSKQTLVELGSRAEALSQMLLDLLEDTHEIRRICIIGRNCKLNRQNDAVECSLPLDKQIAEEEEEEIEMLLENYLQRCESCHGQAERLLDSAKEMEDSIAVNLSSRRLEVSKVELLLQVGTFCVAIGALVAGIFGMNLKSYLEEHMYAFWLTTAGIFVGVVIGFFIVYWYLRKRKIL